MLDKVKAIKPKIDPERLVYDRLLSMQSSVDALTELADRITEEDGSYATIQILVKQQQRDFKKLFRDTFKSFGSSSN